MIFNIHYVLFLRKKDKINIKDQPNFLIRLIFNINKQLEIKQQQLVL